MWRPRIDWAVGILLIVISIAATEVYQRKHAVGAVEPFLRETTGRLTDSLSIEVGDRSLADTDAVRLLGEHAAELHRKMVALHVDSSPGRLASDTDRYMRWTVSVIQAQLDSYRTHGQLRHHGEQVLHHLRNFDGSDNARRTAFKLAEPYEAAELQHAKALQHFHTTLDAFSTSRRPTSFFLDASSMADAETVKRAQELVSKKIEEHKEAAAQWRNTKNRL